MYRENRSFSVVSYFIFRRKLCWLEHTAGGSSKIHFDDDKSLEIEGQIRPSYFVFAGDRILLSDSNKKETYVVKGDEVIGILPGYVVAVVGEFVLLVSREDKTQVLLLNAKFETVQKQALKIGANRFSSDRYFISSEYLNNTILRILDLPSFDAVRVSLEADSWITEDGNSSKGEICQTIGVWNNQLILHLAKFVIVGLDVKTGERLWRIDNFFESIDSGIYIAFGGRSFGRTPMEWHLDAASGMAYLLARHFFVRVDLQHQTCVVEKSYLSDAPEHRWNFTGTRLVDGRIFFVGSKGLNATPNYIGCFGVEEQSVLWENRAADGAYYEEAPRVNDGNLYVLGSNSFLHVFESAG